MYIIFSFVSTSPFHPHACLGQSPVDFLFLSLMQKPWSEWIALLGLEHNNYDLMYLSLCITILLVLYMPTNLEHVVA